VKPNIDWLIFYLSYYVHLCSPEDFTCSEHSTWVLEPPRAGHCCFDKTEEVLVVYWSTFNLNCHMAVSGTTPVLINYHCPTTCCLIRAVIHYCQLPMDPTDFFLMWISIKLTVMRHNLKMLDKKPKKPECVLLLQTDRNA